MAFAFNPLTGQLDITGGSTSAASIRYTDTFNNTTDWTLSSPNYTLTILASTHNRGPTPNVSVYEQNGADYDLVNILVQINATGDVTLFVSSSPDTRFNGLVLII
jgi:hypothetical protein